MTNTAIAIKVGEARNTFSTFGGERISRRLYKSSRSGRVPVPNFEHSSLLSILTPWLGNSVRTRRTFAPSYALAEAIVGAPLGHLDDSVLEDSLMDDFRQKETQWIDANIHYLSQAKAGRWIAVQGSQLVADSDTLPGVYQQARLVGVANPFVTMIPATAETFFGCRTPFVSDL